MPTRRNGNRADRLGPVTFDATDIAKDRTRAISLCPYGVQQMSISPVAPVLIERGDLPKVTLPGSLHKSGVSSTSLTMGTNPDIIWDTDDIISEIQDLAMLL
jgi:hypothetical protein